jgi:hypothetical protein
MSSEPINGSAQLREALSDLIKRYVQHLDIDAPTEITTVKIDASGPGLHVLYAEHDSHPAMLNVSINDFPGPDQRQGNSPEEMLNRQSRWFGRNPESDG